MKPAFERHGVTVYQGSCLAILPALKSESVHCCVTSPPYFGLRDYGCDGQIGLEETPEEYVAKMVTVFREVRRVLRNDGTLWLNLGDSYNAYNGNRGKGATTLAGRANCGLPALPAGYGLTCKSLKAKDLIGIPWAVAFALRADGWYLRSEIIWAKPNGMPGSQQDRCTSSHEAIFMLSKSARYYSDFDAIKTPPRESTAVRLAQDVQSQAGSHRANSGGETNGPMKAVTAKSQKQRGHSRLHAGFNDRWDSMSREEQMSQPAMMRDVWFVPPAQCKEAHFAVMPAEVARRCIVAGSPPGGRVLDPFGGVGTTAAVAIENGCRATLIELNPTYCDLIGKRLPQAILFGATS